jgi:hypothetical protein
MIGFYPLTKASTKIRKTTALGTLSTDYMY